MMQQLQTHQVQSIFRFCINEKKNEQDQDNLPTQCQPSAAKIKKNLAHVLSIKVASTEIFLE